MPHPARILIVEDEEGLAENLRRFLSRRYPDVRVAPDAYHAVEILDAFTPDVVVLDIGLPVTDGLQAYVMIVHRHASQARCVVMTGHLTEGIIRTVRAYGIRHLICKPFSLGELQDMIEQSLAMAPALAVETRNDKAEETMDGSQQSAPCAGTMAFPQQERRMTTDRRHMDRRKFAGRRQFDPRHVHSG